MVKGDQSVSLEEGRKGTDCFCCGAQATQKVEDEENMACTGCLGDGMGCVVCGGTGYANDTVLLDACDSCVAGDCDDCGRNDYSDVN